MNAQKYKNWTQWLVGGKMEVSTITYQFEFTLNFCNFLHTKCTCFAPQFAYFILANTFVQILCAQISELTTPKLWKLFNFHEFNEFRKTTKIFLIIWLVEIKKCSSFETNRIWWFFYVFLIRRITNLSETFSPQQYEFQQGNLAKCVGDFFIYCFTFFGDFKLEIRRILLLGEVPLWSHLQRPSQHRHDLRNLPSWFHLHARCSLFFPSQIPHWPQQCTFSN